MLLHPIRSWVSFQRARSLQVSAHARIEKAATRGADACREVGRKCASRCEEIDAAESAVWIQAKPILPGGTRGGGPAPDAAGP